MTGKGSSPITFNEFTDILSEVLLVEKEKLTKSTSFMNDLSVDSLKLVEMALRIDQLGVSIPPEAYWEIQTVGDAYQTYVSHIES